MAALTGFIILLLSASALPSQAAGKKSSGQKILFVASNPGNGLAGVKVLGNLSNGYWVSAHDQGALALYAKDTSARILFRDDSVYMDRIKGLPKAKIPARMAWPYGQVDDNAENEVIGDLIEETRMRLNEVARAGEDYRAFYDSGFRIVEILYPDTRMESWDALTLIEGLRDDFARLNDEIANLHGRFPEVFPDRDPAIESARERLISTMDLAMHRIRPDYRLKPEPKRSPVAPDWVRGIYVTPYDSVLAHPINGEESETAVRWGNGVMTNLEDRNIHYTERRGLKAQILYLDGHDFVRDVSAFDSTQWPRIFQKRSKPMTAGYLAEHLSGRQFRLIIDAGNRARYLEKKDPALAKEIRNQLRLEKPDLRRMSGYFTKAGFSRKEFQSAWDAYIAELAFSLAWARQGKWPESVPRLEQALILAKSLRLPPPTSSPF